MAFYTNDFLPTLTIKNISQLTSIALYSPANTLLTPKSTGIDYVQYSIMSSGEYKVVAQTPWTNNLTYYINLDEPRNRIIKYVPWDTNTTLLLHGNLTDVSGNNRTPNYSTNVVASKDQLKMNDTCIWKPAGTRFAYDGCLLNDRGDWTAEWWSYCTTINCSMFHYWCGSTDFGVLFSHSTNGVCYSSTNASSWNCFSNNGCGQATGQWIHWCWEKYQNIQTIYKNGVITLTNTTGGTQYANPGCETIFGGYRSGTAYTMTYAGYYDEIRLSKIARYKNSAFIPSTSKFTVEDKFEEVFEVPPTNLLASYNFDKTLYKQDSNNEDISYNPMVLVSGSTIYYQGRHGDDHCLQFNGSSYFKSTYGSIIPKLSPFSISMWFKVNNTNNDTGTNYSSVVPLLSTLNAKNVSGIQVILNIRGQIEFQIIDTDGTTSVAKTNTFYNDSSWHNLIITWTGDKTTNGMNIYVDGVLKGQGTSTTQIIGGQECLYMGNRITTQTSLTGFIQELNIYDRILNQNEIAQINGKELDYIEITSLTKRKYVAEEVTLDLSGLVVTAIYKDGQTEDITSQCDISVNDMEDGYLTSYSDTLTATYNYKGKIYTATLPLNVVGKYLCMTCVTAGTISLQSFFAPTTARTIQYSKDKSSWTTWTISSAAQTATVAMAVGDKCYFRGTNSTLSESSSGNYIIFNTTGQYNISGNINTLLNYNYPVTTIPDYCYTFLFFGGDFNQIINAYQLELPAKEIGVESYSSLFKNNTTLTVIPKKLPSAKQGTNDYGAMFYGCTSIVDASVMKLPIIDFDTQAAGAPYTYMFANCTSLKIPPELPTTAAYQFIYNFMFSGCTSLYVYTTPTGVYNKAWRIPQDGEFTQYSRQNGMFTGCGGDAGAVQSWEKGTHKVYYTYNPNSLSPYICVSHAPTKTEYIEGETLDLSGLVVTYYDASGNSQNVTSQCTFSPSEGSSLTTIGPNTITITYNGLTTTRQVNVKENLCLCFTANTVGSTISMSVNGTPTLGQNFQYSIGGAWQTFTPSTTTITLTNVGDKVYFKGNNPNGVCESRTIYYKFGMTGSISASGNIMSLIDNGACTTTAIPNSYCFYKLFQLCTSLITPPTLPAQNLTQHCYDDMFDCCTHLTTAPVLPATTLAEGCYLGMFGQCLALTTAPSLPATNLASYCYYNMFYRCIALTTVPLLPATTLYNYCYYAMFSACESLYVSDNSISGTAEEAWVIPTNAVASGDYTMSSMFWTCLGTRADGDSPNFNGVQKTYYTQNTPV